MVLTLALAPCGLLLYYYLRQVKQAPEPWLRVATVCAVGGATFFPTLAIQQWSHSKLSIAPHTWLSAFFIVSLSEEVIKLLAVLMAGPSVKKYPRVSAGLIYGISAGLGFAAIENIVYVQNGGASTAILRAVTAVPCHALSSAIVGTALGSYHRSNSRLKAWNAILLNLAVAVVLHGVYDGLIFAGGKFRVAVVPLLALEALLVHFVLRRAHQRDRQRDIDMLRKVPLFADAPISAMGLLADRATHNQVERNREVVREGYPGNALFVVQSGRLLVHRNNEILAELSNGDFVGEIALLTGEPRSATVTTSADSLLLRVPSQALLEAIVKIDGLAGHLIQTAISRGVSPERLPDAEQLTQVAKSSINDVSSKLVRHGVDVELSSIPLFANLSKTDQRQILQACDVFRRGPKSKLVSQGTIGPGICIIVSGEAKVSHNGMEVATLVEGNFFGEINLLTGWLATATVRSFSPLTLVLLEWSDLYGVLSRNPKLGWKLLETLSLRTEELKQALNTVTQTRPSILFRISNRLQSLIMSIPDVDNVVAQDLQTCFPDLKDLPASVSETLADYVSPIDQLRGSENDKQPSFILTRQGEIIGLNELLSGEGFNSENYRSEFESDIDGWYLTKSHTYDSIARCPNVLRFLARGIIRGRKFV